MSKIKVHVTVDIHEPGEVADMVNMHKEIKSWSIGSLDAGDLKITSDANDDVVLFERKTPSDYAGTLVGKEGSRLDEQIDKLKRYGDDAHILIEGDLHDFDNLPRTNIQTTSLRGSVASVQQRDLDVMFCSDTEGLVDMAVRLARKYFEDPSRLTLKPSVIKKDEPFVKRVLGCLEGVGPQTVETIYEQYKSLDELLQLEEECLMALDGIGKKRATAIIEQLNEGQ